MQEHGPTARVGVRFNAFIEHLSKASGSGQVGEAKGSRAGPGVQTESPASPDCPLVMGHLPSIPGP